MFGIGAGELVVILVVALIVFGPSKLPEVGQMIGKGLREFRKAQAALSTTLDDVANEPEKKSAPVINKPVTENNSVAENKTVVAESNSVTEKKSAQVVKDNTAAPNNSMTADDIINLAKTNPIVNAAPVNPENNSVVKADTADKILAKEK
ncbi:MAG: twin-arginine translocase TatA/TatE family subunit [Selenomonadaceae bacterium]|nr:twin-arginine translocase TatA/TatE family subunit [Selenomonadaceae bacterium]